MWFDPEATSFIGSRPFLRRSFSLTRRRGSIHPLFYEFRFQVAGRQPLRASPAMGDDREQALRIPKVAPLDAADGQNREVAREFRQHAAGEIRRRQVTVDSPQDLLFSNGAHERFGPN